MKAYTWSASISDVTISMSLLSSDRDLFKSTSFMFPHSESSIRFSKVKPDLVSELSPSNTKFQQN